MITKKDLIKEVASNANLTQGDTALVVNAFIEAVIDAVAKKEVVVLGDLGRFVPVETKAVAARTMVSGLTGQEISIPARPVGVRASFKISKKIKDAVAGK